jgi:hypothetical protein
MAPIAYILSSKSFSSEVYLNRGLKIVVNTFLKSFFKILAITGIKSVIASKILTLVSSSYIIGVPLVIHPFGRHPVLPTII